MGGKAKILDPKQMQEIYARSKRFDQRTTAGMQAIYKQLNNMSDPAFQSSAFADHYTEARSVILHAIDEIAAVKETLESTSKFIEAKLAEAAHLSKDDGGKERETQLAGRFAYDPRLKK